MANYKFSIPLTIDFIIDESMLSFDTIEEVEEVQEKFDIDLNYIIDKYEYKLESIDYDDDYYALSEEDILSDIITDNWKSIIKKLNKEYKLKDLNDDVIQKIFEITKNDFDLNLNKSIKNLNDNYSVGLSDFNKSKNEFHVTINTDNDLDKTEIEDIMNWLDYETNEMWGEHFSKIDLSDNIDIDDMYVYLKPWSTKKEIKQIK